MEFSTSERRKSVNSRLRDEIEILKEKVQLLECRLKALEEFHEYTPMGAFVAMIVRKEMGKTS